MMKLRVAHKYMNLPKSIALAFSAIALSGNAMSVKAAEVRSANKTFADWCRQRASLSPQAKHTVDVLLQYAETTECDAADRKLSSLTQLTLEFTKITDIKPLASLTNLTGLNLSGSQISGGQISDIKPLASLTNLTWLNLGGNPIAPKTCPLKPESICKW
jgi:internalin A